MQTEYLGPIDSTKTALTTALLERASKRLQQGGLVAFPTETVYGLGASIFHSGAVHALYAVKGREKTHPLPIQLAYFNQLQFVAAAIPPQFHLLAKFFLPGPLTLVVSRHPRVSPLISAGLDSVAVRFPSNCIAQRLIELTGCPLAVPSANVTGKPSPTCAAHVLEDFSGRIDVVVDGGDTEAGIESTVLSLEDPAQPKILRVGAITRQEIEYALKAPVAIDRQIHSAGKKPRFSKLRPTVRLFSSWEEINIYLQLSAKSKRLVMGWASSSHFHYFRLSRSNLYTGLRRADREGYAEVLILCDRELKDKSGLFDHLKQIAHA
ncbi:MAG: L-threonylcarbamoyladenylate synthase [Chlamydiota bacterium]